MFKIGDKVRLSEQCISRAEHMTPEYYSFKIKNLFIIEHSRDIFTVDNFYAIDQKGMFFVVTPEWLGHWFDNNYLIKLDKSEFYWRKDDLMLSNNITLDDDLFTF